MNITHDTSACGGCNLNMVLLYQVNKIISTKSKPYSKMR